MKCRLLKQLYGRRRAGQQWVNFMADFLEEAGCIRCEPSPHFLYHEERRVAIEVHMDDMHGAGPPKGIDKLHKEVKVKFREWTVMSVGDSYMPLKRESASSGQAVR